MSGDGLFVAALAVVQVGEPGQRRGASAGIALRGSVIELEGTDGHGFRFLQASLTAIDHAQGADGRDDLRIGRRAMLFAQRQRLLVERRGAVELGPAHGDAADGLHEARSRQRLIRQLFGHRRFGLFEQLVHGLGVVLAAIRIHGLEEADQELGHLLGFGLRATGPLGLLVGSLGLQVGTPCFLGSGHHAGDQDADHDRHRGQGADVAPYEAREGVAQRRRPRFDRPVLEVAHQVGCEIGDAVVARVALAGRRFRQDGVEIAAQLPREGIGSDPALPSELLAAAGIEARPASAQRRRIGRAGPVQHGTEPEPRNLVRRYADEQLVEQDAQGVDVGPGVDIGAVAEPGRLRAHVHRRAHDHAEGLTQATTVAGQLLPYRAADRSGRVDVVEGAGDAEVDHLGRRAAVDLRDQDIGGLEIPVYEALLVCVPDPGADPENERDPGLDRQPVPIAPIGDVCALDPFHGHESTAVVGHAGVVDRGDVGVLEPGEGLAFGGEAPAAEIALEAVDHLERDPALDRLALLGEVDGSHAAAAELVEHAVGPDLLGTGDQGRIARGVGVGGCPVSQQRGRLLRRGDLEEVGVEGRCLFLEERIDLGAQLGSAGARAIEEWAAGRLVEIEGGVDHRDQLPKIGRCHAVASSFLSPDSA